MDAATYRQLHDRARRLTTRAADADDLVQDVLLAALQAGRDDLPWLLGVLQNQAAMTVRSATRRRRRDALHADAPGAAPDPAEACTPAPDASHLLDRLPPAARRVAVLALHGLAAEEIRWILALTPAAFRQRLTSIRKALGALPSALRVEALALAYLRDPARVADLHFGLVRRALHAAVRLRGGLATHDADGHLFVLSPDAHTWPPRGN